MLSLADNFIKFLAGHSDLLGGAIVCKSKEIRLDVKKQRNTFGNVMGNLEAWLLLRSLRTLKIRVLAQSETACEVAAWLEKQLVEKTEHGTFIKHVWHPSLPSSESYELCKKQMKAAPGIMSLELHTSEIAAAVVKQFKVYVCSIL